MNATVGPSSVEGFRIVRYLAKIYCTISIEHGTDAKTILLKHHVETFYAKVNNIIFISDIKPNLNIYQVIVQTLGHTDGRIGNAMDIFNNLLMEIGLELGKDTPYIHSKIKDYSYSLLERIKEEALDNWCDYIERNDFSIVTNLFKCQLVEIIKCAKCTRTVYHYFTQTSIVLPLPTGNDNVSLNEMIHAYFGNYLNITYTNTFMYLITFN